MKALSGKVYISSIKTGAITSKGYNYSDAQYADDFFDYREGLWAVTGESGVSYAVSPEVIDLGFSSFIILANGCRKMCYACKKVNILPKPAMSLCVNYFKQSQKRESLVASREGVSSYNNNINNINTVSFLNLSIKESDKGTINISGSFTSKREIHKYRDFSYSQEDFWSKELREKRHEFFVDLLSTILPQFDTLLIDKVSIFMCSGLGEDIEVNIKNGLYSYFIGISPYYENPCYVDSSRFETDNYHSPYPISNKKMTYEVALIMFPEKRE